MTPLLFAKAGENMIVRKIGGNTRIKNHLEKLGLTCGAEISLVTKSHDRIIVKVRDSRLALDAKSAGLIFY